MSWRTLIGGNLALITLVLASSTVPTVTTLAVVAAADTAVTLAWAGVASGDASVVHYDVRQATGTFTAASFPWGGNGGSVKSGSCAGNRVSGTSPTGGERVSCVVGGLSASTAYSFELVAYTGTLYVNPVFSALSNVATATTAASTNTAVTTVTISLSQVRLLVGSSVQLSATLTNSAGAVVPGAVTWGASGAVAVTANGLVSALSVGTGAVTATAANGVVGTAAVTVVLVPVRFITITPAVDTETVGGSVQLVATTTDSAGHLLTGRAVTWSDSTRTIISVSPTGMVGALAPGTGRAWAMSEGQSAVALVVVQAPLLATVAAVRLNVAGSVTITAPGGTFQGLATVFDSAGNILARPVSWRSTAPAVASVNASGLVTAVANGADTIVAASGGVSNFFLVSVGLPPQPLPGPVGCGIRVPPPVGCGMQDGTWALLGVDTVNGVKGPWFMDDSLHHPHKVVRVIVADTTF